MLLEALDNLLHRMLDDALLKVDLGDVHVPSAQQPLANIQRIKLCAPCCHSSCTRAPSRCSTSNKADAWRLKQATACQ
eukprot:985733-Alexandrium_andersonii.AAC.1